MSNKKKIEELEAQLEKLREEEKALENWEPTVENVVKLLNRDDNIGDKVRDVVRWGERYEVDVPNNWDLKSVHIEGGGEGCGEDHWAVFSLTKDEEVKYFRVPGYYQSYNGGELYWGEMFEAKPVEKTYIDYEKI